MNAETTSFNYDKETGILEHENISSDTLKGLIKENAILSFATGGEIMYFVNPHIFKMDNPTSLLISLFSEYVKCGDLRTEYQYVKYSNYLQSDYWKNFRDKALKHYKGICAWCGHNQNLHVHHVRYGEWFDEKLDDVVILCSSCHSKAHGKHYKGRV